MLLADVGSRCTVISMSICEFAPVSGPHTMISANYWQYVIVLVSEIWLAAAWKASWRGSDDLLFFHCLLCATLKNDFFLYRVKSISGLYDNDIYTAYCVVLNGFYHSFACRCNRSHIDQWFTVVCSLSTRKIHVAWCIAINRSWVQFPLGQSCVTTLGKLFNLCASVSKQWYWSKDGVVLRLGRWPQAWRKVMAVLTDIFCLWNWVWRHERCTAMGLWSKK